MSHSLVSKLSKSKKLEMSHRRPPNQTQTIVLSGNFVVLFNSSFDVLGSDEWAQTRYLVVNLQDLLVLVDRLHRDPMSKLFECFGFGASYLYELKMKRN